MPDFDIDIIKTIHSALDNAAAKSHLKTEYTLFNIFK